MTLINVCGASFSGTTMLDLMLGNSDDAASCGEVGSWFRPKRHDRVAIRCYCGADPCPRWEPFGDVPRGRFHREAFDRWGVRYLSDSTKTLSWILDSNRWGYTQGIRVANVLIWKQPEAHAYSHWKRRTPLPDARRRFVRYHTRFLGLGIQFVAVNYERLVRSPGPVLAEICRAVGMPYSPGREEFWKRRHHNLFGSVGTANQVGREQGQIRPSEDFPAAFLNAYAAMEQAGCPGPDPREIAATLERFDVRDADPGVFDRPDRRPGRMVGYWYFEDRYKRVLRNLAGRLRPPRMARLVSC